MAEPLPILTTMDLADWVAGTIIREGPIREQFLQNIQYLVEAAAAVNTNIIKLGWYYGPAAAG